MIDSVVLKRAKLYHDREAPICVFRIRDQGPMPTHRHDFVEIAIVLSGKGVHMTGQCRHEIRHGDVMVIRGQRSHAYENTQKLSIVNLLFTEDILDESARMLGSLNGFHPLFTFEFTRWEQKTYQGRLCLDDAGLRWASNWVDGIEMELKPGGDDAYFLARCRIQVLIGMLARHYGKDAVKSATLDLRLGRVLALIDQSPVQAYSITDMARDSGMSERSLLRYFRKATGDSPSVYLLKKRIHLAESLLQEEPLASLTEIAFKCGFNDSNYFSRQFKRFRGYAPRESRSRSK